MQENRRRRVREELKLNVGESNLRRTPGGVGGALKGYRGPIS